MKFVIVITFVFTLQECLSFDLPRRECTSDLKINRDHYNVTDSYDVGDAFPTDAHYDEFGNLFFVESGRNEKGFFFNVKMITEDATYPVKVHATFRPYKLSHDHYGAITNGLTVLGKVDHFHKQVPISLMVKSGDNGLPEGTSYSIAVDRKDTKVYFGTDKGIYSFDYDTSTAELASESTLKINMIFVDRDGNKFITESSNGVEELFLLNGRKKIRFHTLEALNELAIDENNNFYFIREEKLFVLKSNLSTPKCLGNVTYDGVAQISVHKGRVFVASENLLHFDENATGDLELIENIPGKATAIAFDDGGDFVLGIQSKLLKYRKSDCYFRNNNSE